MSNGVAYDNTSAPSVKRILYHEEPHLLSPLLPHLQWELFPWRLEKQRWSCHGLLLRHLPRLSAQGLAVGNTDTPQS